MALLVRAKEYLLVPFVDHLLLAEEKYAEELKFGRKKHTVILNKYNPLYEIKKREQINPRKELKFLYSGTIAEVYGIHDAILFYQKIKSYCSSSLTIVGHCPSNELFKALHEIAHTDTSIHLKIAPYPIDHLEILLEYRDTDFALTPYKSNPSTENCIPVKFYELIAHNIPIVVSNQNDFWITFLSDYHACFPINFSDFNPEVVIRELLNSNFYTTNTNTKIFWESEKDKLLHILVSVL
jgi:glycosyltransferase involved in cell wall biosynthesis